MKRIKIGKSTVFIGIIFIFIILTALILMRSAPFSIDEASYLLTIDALSKTGKLQIVNDYGFYLSPELNCYKGIVRDNIIVTKYPPLYFYLVQPFYQIKGIEGIFWLNLFASFGSIIVFYLIAKMFFEREQDALEGLILLVFSTFFIEYAFTIWPHMLSLFLSLSAIYLLLKGVKNRAKDTQYLFYAGLTAAVSIGVRLADILLPALMIIYILWEKENLMNRLASLLFGLFPPLGLISFINYQRFSSLNPLTYGDSSSSNVLFNGCLPYIALIAFILLLMNWALFKYKKRNISDIIRHLKKRKILFLSSITVFLAGILGIFISNFKEFVQFGKNFLAYNINIIFLDKVPYEGADYINSSILSYEGVIKKALMQSCPYLILILLSPLILKKSRIDKSYKRMILLFSLGYPLFFSLFLFHGGMGFNFRYFLNLLPWGIFITLIFLKEVNPSRDIIEILIMTIVVYSLVLSLLNDSHLISIILIVWVPTIIVIGIVITYLLSTFKLSTQAAKRFLDIFIIISIGISFSLAFFKDIPSSIKIKANNYYKSEVVADNIPKNSFLFVYWGYKDSLAVAKINKNLTIADYHINNGRNLFTLLERNLDRGRPVFIYGEGVHPQLLELLRMEYSITNISRELIPIYRINRKNRFLELSEDYEQ